MWNKTRNNVPVAPSVLRSSGAHHESPLVGVARLVATQQASAAKTFRLTERPFLELVGVRGDATDPAFVRAFEGVLGCRPPATPNTTAVGNGYDVLWLGPDEWLALSQEAQAATLEGKLRTAFEGLFASAVDIGSGNTVLKITGERVRDVLARGCPLDLHPRVFAPGQCAQSHYFKASIVLVPVSDDTYELVVRRSFADYFCRIMLDAAAPLIL